MELREQLEEALEKLLATGGDSRQVQDPDSGLTKYGCSMKPRPDVTPLGSCTASSISETGYAAAAMLLERCRALSSDVDLADVVSEYFDAIRSELQFHFCRHDVRDLDILLSPSGTDAELLALAIAHGVGRPMVTNILIGPSEVGSGTPAAAAGQYFDELTPSGRQAKPGEPIDHEMASRTSLVCISLREANGLPRDEKEIDSEVEAIVAERVGQGHQILLHVIAHSKTGLHAPSLQTVRGLKAQHGERITVVVDAAQGRFSRRGLRRACDDGHLVMTTGSKFFGGPPFAGALLVPPAANPLARGMAAMPVAFGDFFAQDYFPASWASVAANLPRTGSLGALLRWAAALAEIREYYATPSRLRLQVLRAFEHAVPDVLGSSSCIRMDEISEPVLGDEVERLLQSKTTVFSFFVLRRNGEALGYEALRKIWRWLNLDMSAYADAAKTSSSSRDLAPCMQIGQPVRLGSGDGAAAVLRVALGGALLTHVAQDPNWGGTYEQREARMIDSLILLKRKIEAIVNHFDHLVEQEAALESLGDRVAEAQIEGALIKALGSGVVTESDRAVVFHDMCLLRDRLQHLQSEFPPRTLHAVAIKANPIVAILRALVEQGAGLEAASLEETALALAAGCPPERIVFDSPAKTVAELHEALRLGFVLNVDNFAELARIDEILATSSTASLIGLRVNPMVGAGSIGITSVADGGSKFGVRIDIERDAIFEAFARYDWLRGLHMHVGSQGCDLDLFVRAASVIEDLYTEITRRFGAERVAFVDIGGGLPVEYTAADKPPSLTEFLAAMSAAVPSLFDGKVRLITEFGRAVHSGCGFAASRVEYVKGFADHELAVIHLGADMFMRPVYLPEQWKHRFLVCDCHGRIKRGARKRYTIGGPLCFAGDLVARDLELPAIEPGDFVVVRDVGAYTVSMWSRHCSRGLPKVVGFDADRDNALQVLLRPETPADVVQFWGGAEL